MHAYIYDLSELRTKSDHSNFLNQDCIKVSATPTRKVNDSQMDKYSIFQISAFTLLLPTTSALIDCIEYLSNVLLLRERDREREREREL
jgi:hypothetical protein